MLPELADVTITSPAQQVAYQRQRERKQRLLREATLDRNGRTLGAKAWGWMMRTNRGVVR